MKDREPVSASTKKAVVALSPLILSGVAAIALAAAGMALWGVVLFALGAGASFYLSTGEKETAKVATIAEFLKNNPPGEPGSDPLASEIRTLLEHFRQSGESIRNIVRYLQEHATLVAWLIDNFDQAAKEANEQLAEITKSAGLVNDRGAKMLEGSRKGQDFVSGIAASATELAGDADSLSVSAESSEGVVASLQNEFGMVEEAISRLAVVSDQSTKFVSEVSQTMGTVRESTVTSLELFKNVEEYAKRGRQVVGKVGEGVEEIRKSSAATMDRINELTIQSKQIGDVLEIINDVADETALLALNAAILAAQAGERGAAFAVVADQIRSLARRTAESTGHIENIVKSVQRKIDETRQLMGKSVNAVGQGESMGREAVVQLDLIEKAVREAVGQADSIAEAVDKQSEMTARMVSDSMEVNIRFHSIMANLSQSAVEMDRIGVLVTNVTALSSSVRNAAEGNRASSVELGGLMANFVGQVEEIEGIVVKQREGVMTMENAMSSVSSSAESARESLDSIHKIVNELVTQSDSLKEEVQTAGLSEEEPEESKEKV